MRIVIRIDVVDPLALESHCGQILVWRITGQGGAAVARGDDHAAYQRGDDHSATIVAPANDRGDRATGHAHKQRLRPDSRRDA